MRFRMLLLSVLTFVQLKSFAQLDEKILYQKAYDYLNDSIVKSSYPNVSELEKDCSQRVKQRGRKLKYHAELHVAHKFIENNWGFPLEDFVHKNYKLTVDCVKAIRVNSNACETANQILDSLNTFWKNYIMKESNEILNSVEGLLSTRKDGYQVFFSDIYKNTVAAELKFFCSFYDQINWYGSSTSFYFVFDKHGEIKAIYSGIVIHYN